MQGAVLCLTVVHSDVILVSAVLTNLTISVGLGSYVFRPWLLLV